MPGAGKSVEKPTKIFGGGYREERLVFASRRIFSGCVFCRFPLGACLFLLLWLFPLSPCPLMFFIKLTRGTSTLSPRCLHNIVYNSRCVEFHFIPAGSPCSRSSARIARSFARSLFAFRFLTLRRPAINPISCSLYLRRGCSR